MMATAKAITNGFFPFGATMIGERMVEVFEGNAEAKIAHGYTYSGHPVGAAAALACLAETKRLNVVENAAARGAQLFEGCKALQAKYERIGDVRGGHGLMTAIEMVSNRTTKKPIDANSANKIQEIAYQSGAMIRISGPNIILSPSLVLSERDAATILSALDAAFAAL